MDTVVIIGSQAVLIHWPVNPPTLLVSSAEIDAYPKDPAEWQRRHKGQEASEEIHGLFGEGSQFHNTHGFYIDGVDEKTALLPPDWQTRQKKRTVTANGRRLHAIAPEINDLALSKLLRLDPKDEEFIQELYKHDRIDPKLMVERLATIAVEEPIKERVRRFIAGLGEQNPTP